MPHLDGHPGHGVHATEITGHVYRAQHHALVRFDRRRYRTGDGAPGGAATGSIRAGPGHDPRAARPRWHQHDAADFGPAVPKPRRILSLGLSPAEHALAGGRQVLPSAGGVRARCRQRPPAIRRLVSPALTDRVEDEGERGVVIGTAVAISRRPRRLSDSGLRRAQRRLGARLAACRDAMDSRQELRGQLPIGPELVTADEVDVSDIALTTTLNGQVMQSARTSQMIVDVPQARRERRGRAHDQQPTKAVLSISDRTCVMAVVSSGWRARRPSWQPARRSSSHPRRRAGPVSPVRPPADS